MRTIEVSTDVFARIWALREAGEESEDAILRRLLQSQPRHELLPQPPTPAATVDEPASTGFRDRRHDVNFPEGFEIYRYYKGARYQAVASGERWLLENNGQPYESLAKLSRAVGSWPENSWANWLYRDRDGRERPISEMRDPYKISRRGQRAADRL